MERIGDPDVIDTDDVRYEPMQTEMTRDRVSTILAAAEAAAGRLEWRLRLPWGEREDLRQELLIDLLRRLPAFDPERGAFEAFVQVVLRNHSARLASRVVAQRRARGGALLSLHHPADGDPRPICDRLAEDDGLWAGTGEATRETTRVELRLDVDRVLDCLTDADRQLCTGLASGTAAALSRSGLGSRSQLYRRVAELRCAFTAYGLGPAWGDLARLPEPRAL